MDSQLWSGLNSQDSRVRTVTAQLLSNSSAGMESLVKMLARTGSPEVRASAATTLGRLREPGVALLLWNRLPYETNLMVCAAIYAALGQLNAVDLGPGLVRHLRAYLGDTEADGELSARLLRNETEGNVEVAELLELIGTLIHTVGLVRAKEAASSLITCLQHDLFVEEALDALARLALPEAAGPILSVVARRDEFLAEGVAALVAIGAPAVDALIAGLTDPATVPAAELVLQQIGDPRGLRALLLAYERPAHGLAVEST